jgi:hypothetical protein
MNERIRELELEAAYGNIDPNGPFTAEEFNQFTAKFAELIVRECVQVCLSQRDPANLNYKPSVKFAEAVKQHFGVEE